MALGQKKAAPAHASITELEREQVALRTRINEQRDQQVSLQRELASLLAAQRGMALQRAPLEQAIQTASRTVQEAQEALTRNIGKPTETVYADKLYQAEQVAKQAASALADFDKQQTAATKERVQVLREALTQTEQELKQLESRQLTLTHTLDQAIAAERTATLTRLLSAYQDLYTILESDGHALARMRNSDAVEFERLMNDLVITYDHLWDCVMPSYTTGGFGQPDFSDAFRPFLAERQQIIRERLARLKK